MTIRTDLAYAQELDDRDELREFRQRFVIDEAGLIYVDGNSLGRLPRACLALGQDLIGRQWGSLRLVVTRFSGSIPNPLNRVTTKLAVAALRIRPGRTRLVTDDLNFPSDLYVLQSALRLFGPPHPALSPGGEGRARGNTGWKWFARPMASPSRSNS